MKILPTQSNEQFSRTVAIIVRGLKIIGLAPLTFKRIEKLSRNPCGRCYNTVFLSSKIELAYNFSLFILILVMGAVAIPHIFSVTYESKSPLSQAIVIMQVTSNITVSCVIVAVEALRQKTAISTMNRLLEVDSLLYGMTKHPRSQRITLMFLSVQMIFNALLWVTLWATETWHISSFLYAFIFNVPIFVIYWFILKYSIVLAFIAVELESLNKILLNFEEFPNYSFHTPVLHDFNPSVLSSPTHRSQLTTLKVLRNIRITLSEVSEDVEDFFSIPILSGVACSFVTLVAKVHYLLTPMILSVDQWNIYSEVNAIAWITISFFPLVILSFNVTKTLKEARLTGRIVHKVLAKMTRPEIQKELERFSLQLTHENLTFTAHGFFSLDFTLIQWILGTTATYLVIMVQFIQSTTKISENTESPVSGTNI